MFHGMMRAALLVLFLVSPVAAEDRFAPDNPWFRDFEATCRSGADMLPDCEGSVLGAYAEYAGTTPDAVKCDFRAFWRVRDETFGSKADTISVLPWQYGVEAIVQTDGVCTH